VTAAVAAAKTLLRAEARLRLARAGAADREAKSRAIVERLDALPGVRGAERLLLHRSLPSEVATEALLATALARGQRVFAPRVAGRRLRFVEIDYDTRWRRSTLGVFEPESGSEIDFAEASLLVVVPGLAFDERGHRLGRGGGHYDRFLAEARAANDVEAIAVAFELQIVPEVPAEAHDQRVDRVVTEKRTIAP